MTRAAARSANRTFWTTSSAATAISRRTRSWSSNRATRAGASMITTPAPSVLESDGVTPSADRTSGHLRGRDAVERGQLQPRPPVGTLSAKATSRSDRSIRCNRSASTCRRRPRRARPPDASRRMGGAGGHRLDRRAGRPVHAALLQAVPEGAGYRSPATETSRARQGAPYARSKAALTADFRDLLKKGTRTR